MARFKKVVNIYETPTSFKHTLIWYNFIVHVRSESNIDIWDSPDHFYALNYCDTQIRKYLKLYKAKLNDNEQQISFYNENYYNLFILKYG